MESTVKKLENSQVLLTIKTTKKDTDPYFDKALKKLGSELKIKGFRKGHVPEDVIKKHISQEGVEIEALEMMVQDFYMHAVNENKVRPIAAPRLEIKEKDPYVFELTVDIFPEVKVKSVDGISVKTKDIKVTDKDVKDSIDVILEQNAEYKEVKRVAKKDDRIEIDFEGFIDGKAFEGGSSKHHPVIIGKGMMIPGFEDGLIGLKAGDKKRIKVTFPKDYQAENLKGKKAEFEILVHQVDSMNKPKLDDGFAKKITGNQDYDLAKLKDEVKVTLEHKAKQDEQHRIESDVIQQIIKKTTISLPKTLLDEELEYMWQGFDDRLKQQGLDAEKYLAAQKQTKADVYSQWNDEALSRVTLRLGLAQLSEDLKIIPDANQVEALLNQFPKNERQSKKGMVELQVKLDNTLQHIIDNAISKK